MKNPKAQQKAHKPAPAGSAATLDEFAAELRCSRRYVYLLIEQGSVRSIRIGGTRRIPPDERERVLRDGIGSGRIRTVPRGSNRKA